MQKNMVLQIASFLWMTVIPVQIMNVLTLSVL